jgi:hypothetical protein
MATENIRLLDPESRPANKPGPTTPAWYVYRRASGRRRGSFAGPFDGPDAALAYLRDALELELLLLDEAGRSSSLFRISRRLHNIGGHDAVVPRTVVNGVTN